MTVLPLNYARCLGKPAGAQGLQLQDECRTCLRQLAPRAGAQTLPEPPNEAPCPSRIPCEQMGG